MEQADAIKTFGVINLDEKVIDSIRKNKKVVAKLTNIIELAGGKADKGQGNLLYALSTKLPPTQDPWVKSFVEQIMSNNWSKVMQLEEAIAFMKEKLASVGDKYVVDKKEFELASGVGINVTEADCQNLVDKFWEQYSKDINELKYDFQFSKILYGIKEANKWADSKIVNQMLSAKQKEVLGEKPAADGKRKKANKMTADEKKAFKVNAPKDPEANPTTGKDIMDLIGRDCDIGANSEEIIKKHKEFTGGRIMTRFPPEPNGYLHIGHAKAIRFNFTVAKENGGSTYLRFDDTNPCKENHEFIDHIKQSVAWLGYEPYKVTYSSDYFQELYDFAVKLIKNDKAYICHQSGEEMSKYRNEKKDSPYRNRSVEENLDLFEKMRQGRFDEGECCLRVKMNMQHENPCMRDFVAYRIRFVDHPMSGDKWCVYPTYDYTHCIVDSLENITHSLCTLEFEIRRESYFQLLKDLDIYKPYVWEYSRLNISYAVMSKRKIEKLVTEQYVDGWNDPRLLTLEGLKRRGYTPSMINDFCAHLGVSRKGNENLTSIKLLEKFARVELDRTAPRTFAVMNPILLEIVNLDAAKETKIKAPIFPADAAKGTQTYTLTKNVYIDAEDFSEKHIDKFFGLTDTQPVCLKYGPVVKLVEVVKNADGSINHAKVEILPDYAEKLKGYIHWVSKENSMKVEAHLYSVLFTTEDINKTGDKWQEYINPDSHIIKKDAVMWNLQKKMKHNDRFQFERSGYFVVDRDSDAKKGNYRVNRIVELKESKDKAVK